MATKKSILVLTSTFPRWNGDVEPPFVYELCKRLAKEFEVIVLAPHTAGALKTEIMEGVSVQRFVYAPSRWEKLAYQGGIVANLKQCYWRYLLLPMFFIAQLIAFFRIVAVRRIDVVHAHWLIPQGLTAIIAGLFLQNQMPPVITTSHGGDLLGLNGRFLKQLKRWVIQRSARVTVVSRAMTTQAFSMRVRPEHLHVISMGVDTQSTFTPDTQIKREDKEILFVGRLVEKKGLQYLIQAMKIILQKDSEVYLRIVGEGPEKKVLEALAKQLHIEHAIIFLGAVQNSDLPQHYRRATIFVAPSVIAAQGDQEGLGLVMVEALACGCPVVATDVPAMGDVISPGVGGLIVHQKSPAQLASAILELLEDPVLRKKMADTGRSHAVDQFDWSVIADRYCALFNEVT